MIDKDFFKNKRILITGHTGFKGTWLSKILIDYGVEVIGYSLNPDTVPNLFDLSEISNQMVSIIGDIRDYEMLKKTMDTYQPEIIFHMAAQPLVRESYSNPKYTYETNFLGTLNLLEIVRVTDYVKSFVNVTTDKVYKNNEWIWGYREDETLDGYDPYSNSKSLSELVTHTYNRSFFKHKNIAVSTARAGNVIGGGDFSADRIIPDCVKSIMNHKTMIIRNPNSIRPYQHVLEPLFAYMKLAQMQYSDIQYADCYNIGPEEENSVTTVKLVSLFYKHFGKQHAWKIQNDNGPHEANFLKLDITKFKHTFQWTPVWSIDKAILKTVEWTKNFLNQEDNISDFMQRQINEYVEDLK